MIYTVEGDNVIKQSANNIADPEILGATQKMSRVLSKKSTKVIMDSKGVKQTIEIKDGKVVQDLEVDFSVASIKANLEKHFLKNILVSVIVSASQILKGTGKNGILQKRRTNLPKISYRLV